MSQRPGSQSLFAQTMSISLVSSRDFLSRNARTTSRRQMSIWIWCGHSRGNCLLSQTKVRIALWLFKWLREFNAPFQEEQKQILEKDEEMKARLAFSQLCINSLICNRWLSSSKEVLFEDKILRLSTHRKLSIISKEYIFFGRRRYKAKRRKLPFSPSDSEPFLKGKLIGPFRTIFNFPWHGVFFKELTF